MKRLMMKQLLTVMLASALLTGGAIAAGAQVRGGGGTEEPTVSPFELQRLFDEDFLPRDVT